MDPSEQIAPMWEAFLGQMTAQGATRLDIAQMALATSLVVLESTQTALWPDGQAPTAEVSMRDAYNDAAGMVRAIADGLTRGAAQDS